ncbi:MAG: amino acid racemase [Alphaproteobacteria bacterium]|nr:amino acid racemase [Alphaproteobacteria bacterium]
MTGGDVNNPSAAETRLRPDLLGVIGGMGPLATVDFLSKLVALTPAEKDPDHVPVIVSSEPQIPSRPRAYFDPNENPSPVAAIRARRDMLLGAGAQCLVMPCNTAHYWYEELTSDCPVPFIHIVEATRDELRRRNIDSGALGLIGTEATLAGGLFERPLADAGYECIQPEDRVMQDSVRPGIDLVKRHKTADAEPYFRSAVRHLLDRGAAAVVLGCTEVPAGLPMGDPWIAEKCVDPTAALAKAALDWALTVRKNSTPG